MSEIETNIRERAYHLWLAGGCREGEADQHWLAAERELLAQAMTAVPAKAPRARTPRSAPKPKKQRAA